MPCQNEVWLLSVGHWDDEDRIPDEEYYAIVESVDFTKDPAEFTVQDLEEADGSELVTQNRHRFIVFFVCLAIV